MQEYGMHFDMAAAGLLRLLAVRTQVPYIRTGTVVQAHVQGETGLGRNPRASSQVPAPPGPFVVVHTVCPRLRNLSPCNVLSYRPSQIYVATLRFLPPRAFAGTPFPTARHPPVNDLCSNAAVLAVLHHPFVPRAVLATQPLHVSDSGTCSAPPIHPSMPHAWVDWGLHAVHIQPYRQCRCRTELHNPTPTPRPHLPGPHPQTGHSLLPAAASHAMHGVPQSTATAYHTKDARCDGSPCQSIYSSFRCRRRMPSSPGHVPFRPRYLPSGPELKTVR